MRETGPLPIEEEIDYDMVMYAVQEGVEDPSLLKGFMCKETVSAINNVKLKHKTCKSKSIWSNI